MTTATLRAQLVELIPGTTPAKLLLAASLAAWLLLILSPPTFFISALCASGAIDWASLPERIALSLSLNPLPKLLGAALLMVCAMMLPFAHAPLGQILGRRAGQGEAMAGALFLTGFVAMWLAALAAITAFALLLRILTGNDSALALGFGLLLATLWQPTRLKARCLARSRGIGNGPALTSGALSAAACAGSCWALMLLPFLAGAAHLAAMAGVTLLMLLDRRARRGRFG